MDGTTCAQVAGEMAAFSIETSAPEEACLLRERAEAMNLPRIGCKENAYCPAVQLNLSPAQGRDPEQACMNTYLIEKQHANRHRSQWPTLNSCRAHLESNTLTKTTRHWVSRTLWRPAICTEKKIRVGSFSLGLAYTSCSKASAHSDSLADTLMEVSRRQLSLASRPIHALCG